jgi:uncharacterized repeat protein (TIGR03803 family)
MVDFPLVHVLLACAAAMPAAAQAASFATTHSFGKPNFGFDAGGAGPALRSTGPETPYAGLVLDAAGNFFGTAYGGGDGGGVKAGGAGAVFELSQSPSGGGSWTLTTLHSFSAQGAEDGRNPMAALILGARGVLFGTTSAGGGPGNAGGGTVFALIPPALPGGAWVEDVLYVFPAGAGTPASRLLQDGSGVLYGTTLSGGTGLGSVYKLSPPAPGQTAWVETTLYRFGASASDGESPLSGLASDASGALYGTTEYTDGRHGDGTIYRLTPPASGAGAWQEQTLFNFPGNGAYGSRPDGDLLIGPDDAIYGTAVSGGSRNGGTVFRLNPPVPGKTGWACRVLYSFTGHTGDTGPEGGVIFGPAGTLLGTTSGSLKLQQGTVFQLLPGTDATQSWSEQILARFPTLPAGGGLFPVGDLVAGEDSNYVGVTELGGSGGAGTVFTVRP